MAALHELQIIAQELNAKREKLWVALLAIPGARHTIEYYCDLLVMNERKRLEHKYRRRG